MLDGYTRHTQHALATHLPSFSAVPQVLYVTHALALSLYARYVYAVYQNSRLHSSTVQVSTLGSGKASKTYSILDDDDPLLSVGDSGSTSVNPAINSGNTDGDEALLEESSVGNALEHTGNPTLNRVTKVVIGMYSTVASFNL